MLDFVFETLSHFVGLVVPPVPAPLVLANRSESEQDQTKQSPPIFVPKASFVKTGSHAARGVLPIFLLSPLKSWCYRSAPIGQTGGVSFLSH